jgi:hypothetical protein
MRSTRSAAADASEAIRVEVTGKRVHRHKRMSNDASSAIPAPGPIVTTPLSASVSTMATTMAVATTVDGISGQSRKRKRVRTFLLPTTFTHRRVGSEKSYIPVFYRNKRKSAFSK